VIHLPKKKKEGKEGGCGRKTTKIPIRSFPGILETLETKKGFFIFLNPFPKITDLILFQKKKKKKKKRRRREANLTNEPQRHIYLGGRT
jgi:hypothetical protein